MLIYSIFLLFTKETSQNYKNDIWRNLYQQLTIFLKLFLELVPKKVICVTHVLTQKEKYGNGPIVAVN